MGLIILLTYLFVFKSYKYQERLGNDERYPLIEEKKIMEKIIEIHKKKELLDDLQSNKINVVEKIKKINDFYGNEIKPSNMLSGGLLDDWNFEI